MLQPAASTPQTLPMQLYPGGDDIYRIVVKSYIESGIDGAAQTPCLEADLWRVGPRQVSWPLSETFELPLDYATALPDGVYAEHLALRVLAYDGLMLGRSLRVRRAFEIVDGALRPLQLADYYQLQRGLRPRDSLGFSIAGGYPFQPPPPDFCAVLPPTDEASPGQALSIVDFDTWHGADSLQPFRLDAVAQTLSYQTTASEDVALELRLVVAADIAVSETRVLLGERSRVWLQPPLPRSRDEFWGSRSGTAYVRPLEDGRLSIELSDVVMENAHDPSLLRSLPPGSIVGSWVESP